MVSHRPYRPAYKMDDIIDELVKNADILYDKDVVNAFIEIYNEENS